MQEHRTQWNDMNNPEATEDQRVKSVSRETQVIAWPPVRPGRVLTDVFEDRPPANGWPNCSNPVGYHLAISAPLATTRRLGVPGAGSRPRQWKSRRPTSGLPRD
jgi:hypothetical protein